MSSVGITGINYKNVETCLCIVNDLMKKIKILVDKCKKMIALLRRY